MSNSYIWLCNICGNPVSQPAWCYYCKQVVHDNLKCSRGLRMAGVSERSGIPNVCSLCEITHHSQYIDPEQEKFDFKGATLGDIEERRDYDIQKENGTI